MIFWFFNAADGALVSRVESSDASSYLGSPVHTQVEPPQCQQGWWPAWNGSSWSCVMDYRGTAWTSPSGEISVISVLGQEPAPGSTQFFG